MNYEAFLSTKTAIDVPTGFEPAGLPIKRALFDFQADIVRWALRRGRAAIFADCGLGKTSIQLAWANEVADQTRKPVIILAPLAVAEQTVSEGSAMGVEVVHCREAADIAEHDRIIITNYERLHLFDASIFGGVVLDESSILKAFGGSTRKQITDSFRSTPYKLACTATPAPNDLIEIINHAEFLGVMGGKEIIALFFKQDGNTTHKWRLKGHAQADFWKWICTWAVNIRKPSDLGYSDDGFTLPGLTIVEHVVSASHAMDGWLFPMPASTMQERRDARRASLSDRVSSAAGIANASDEQFIAWCNLNAESVSLAKAIDNSIEVTGSDSDSHKIGAVRGFLSGEHRALVTKPEMFGFGLNLQCCQNMLFVGLSDSYEQFYQAVRRCWRFGQKHPVRVGIVISDLEGAVLANIRRKEADAATMAAEMVHNMADISSAEIRGQKRDVAIYQPKQTLALPAWMET